MRARDALIGVWHRVVALVRRRRLSREIDDELAFHLAMREQDHVRQGHRDAALAARRQFGNVSVVKEQVRDMWTFPSFESIWRDVRYALRTLWRSPGFAVVAVLALAISIGATTSIYSLVDAVFVKGLPYPEPDRLVMLIGNVKRATRVERRGGSYPDFADWRAQSRSFEGMAIATTASMTLSGSGEPERLTIETVSAPYFSLLGITQAQGRTFRPDEDEVAGRNPVVVISDGLWKRRFGGDASIVGQSIQFGTRGFQVIGIAPPGFRGISDQAEAWVPYTASVNRLDTRGSRGFFVLARLSPGVTRAQAQSELDAISKRLEAAYPDTNQGRAVEVDTLSAQVFGPIQVALGVLMAAVVFVLLIACTNVANLLISRSEARQREIAVRTALGAGQGRLSRQLLTESCVLAVIAGLAGIALTAVAVPALVAASPVTLPTFVRPGINWSVLAFALASALGCGMLLGLAPIVHARGGRLTEALKSSARGSSSGRSQRMRTTLVVVQVALAVILLVGASLMIRSAYKVIAIDPGFDPENLLTLRVNIPRVVVPPSPAPPAGATPATPPPPPPLIVPAQTILERVRAVPGVRAASLVSDVPLSGNDSAVFYAAEGDTTTDAKTAPRAYIHFATPELFQTLGIPFRAGRTFSDAEMQTNANVVVVSENVVRRFWPGQDPIGKRVKFGSNPWLTIVGVVAETNYRGLPRNPTADPDLYFPALDSSVQSLAIRTSVPPDSVAPAIRAAIRDTHPSVVIFSVSSMADYVRTQTAPARFTTWLLGLFAATALGLAVIGLYGVMSYLVALRRREFGIRLALGASRREIVALVLRHGARMVGIGLAIGIAGALALSRLLDTLLYDVGATDPAFSLAIALLAIVALLACYVPALRATRVSPVTALRVD
jgi:predicted permease